MFSILSLCLWKDYEQYVDGFFFSFFFLMFDDENVKDA